MLFDCERAALCARARVSSPHWALMPEPERHITTPGTLHGQPPCWHQLPPPMEEDLTSGCPAPLLTFSNRFRHLGHPFRNHVGHSFRSRGKSGQLQTGTGGQLPAGIGGQLRSESPANLVRNTHAADFAQPRPRRFMPRAETSPFSCRTVLLFSKAPK